MPQFMKEIVAELTHLARRSHDVSQRSGVSVRMSVANYENLVSNALRRVDPTRRKAGRAAHQRSGRRRRLDDRQDRARRARRGARRSGRRQADAERDLDDVQPLLLGARNSSGWSLAFDNGLSVEASEMMPSMDYVHQLSHLEGVGDAVDKLGVAGNPAAVASAVEFVLEGLASQPQAEQRRTAAVPARYQPG